MQLDAIQALGRHVLAAKKGMADSQADAEQLTKLRSAIDRLLAVELAPRLPITVQGKESAAQREASLTAGGLRESVHAEGRAVAAQLRERARAQGQRERGDASANRISSGFAMDEQRARLFERWAEKLEAALSDEAPRRTEQLQVLRSQLRATKGSLVDAPLTHGTPTLQSMPAGLAAPGSAGQP